jgi:predicted RNase H-like nuclease (RuvC/YqgF family)
MTNHYNPLDHEFEDYAAHTLSGVVEAEREHIRDLELKVEGLGQENTELERRVASLTTQNLALISKFEDLTRAARDALDALKVLRSALSSKSKQSTEIITRLLEGLDG